MKIIVSVTLMFLVFFVEANGFELEQSRMPLDKRGIALVYRDATGEAGECDELTIKNRQALQGLLSQTSLDKANIQSVLLAVFGERANIVYRVDVGREPAAVRYRRYADRVTQAISTVETQQVPVYNSNGERKFARDVAGAVLHARNNIVEEHLSTVYNKVYLIFVSSMLQSLSKEQTAKWLENNHIKFPDNVVFIVLGKSFVCQDVSEIERQILVPKVKSFWQTVTAVKDFRFIDNY